MFFHVGAKLINDHSIVRLKCYSYICLLKATYLYRVQVMLDSYLQISSILVLLIYTSILIVILVLVSISSYYLYPGLSVKRTLATASSTAFATAPESFEHQALFPLLPCPLLDPH